MKKIIKLLTMTVFAMLMLGSVVKGDDAPPNLPENAWELHGESTDFAAILTAKTDKQPSFLIVYLINNTNSRVMFVISGHDSGFQFFFTDANGVKYNLHNYDYIIGGSHDRIIMIPGEIQSFKIELTSADIALMKSTPIQCSFRIINLATKQNYDITTSPKTYSLPQ